MLNCVIVILFNRPRLFKKTCDWGAALFHHMTNTFGYGLGFAVTVPCPDALLHVSHVWMSSPTREDLHLSEVTECTSCPVWQEKELWSQEGRVLLWRLSPSQDFSEPPQALKISGLFGWEVFALLAVACLHWPVMFFFFPELTMVV